MATKKWYLLYGGTSVDGYGPGEYKGRTEDPEVARKWFEKVDKNFYSVGYVRVIDDDSDHRAFLITDI